MTLPQQFTDRLKGLMLPGGDRMLQSLEEGVPDVSVRPNTTRPWLPDDSVEPVKWHPTARYLNHRPPFTFMPQLHQGRFYVQDASSMFIAEVIRRLTDPSKPVVYLDACAAPGGKTTTAIDALPEGSLVVANEFDRRRSKVLIENVVKWGSPYVVVTQGDTAAYRKQKTIFDIVAVDAPCSGEGMFRKEPEAVAQWSPRLVDSCATLQREIIANVWESLKPGGLLIYSTCTFNREENENQLEWMTEELGAESVELEIDESWGILRSPLADGITCFRFMPGVIRGEGLFMGVVRKPGNQPTNPVSAKTKPDRPSKPSKQSPVAAWLDNPDDFIIETGTEAVTAFPRRYAATLRRLSENLNILYRGVTLATVKGRDLLPEHSLAMSRSLRRGAFPEVELTLDESLTYLRREVITLPQSTPRGYAVVTFQGYPLGFVKNIGNRANNLYPLEWRILRK